MFWKKNKIDRIIIDGYTIRVDNAAYDYIRLLTEKLQTAERDAYRYRSELNHIKPILKNKDFKPAISADCRNCIYVVKTPWDGCVLGCRKDNLCEDFKPMEE